MNGHWVSQTRKLNKHYQSGNRVSPVPLWGTVAIIGCGGCISQLGEYGLILEHDGIYVSNGGGLNKEIFLGQENISTLQGNILPLFYILYDSISINGSPFPNLRNSSFSDSTGLLKFKYTSVTLTYGNQTETANVILVYINRSDLSMRSQYVTNYMNFYNVKWNYRFLHPASSPIKLTVNRTGLRLHDVNGVDVGSGNIAYEKTYSLDANGNLLFTPPTLGSGVILNNSYSGINYQLLDGVFGGCGFEYNGYHNNLYYYDGINGYDQYDEPIVYQGVYDNFQIPTVHYCYSGFITISDNDGLYYDKLLAGSNLEFDIGNTAYNSSQIVRWT